MVSPFRFSGSRIVVHAALCLAQGHAHIKLYVLVFDDGFPCAVHGLKIMGLVLKPEIDLWTNVVDIARSFAPSFDICAEFSVIHNISGRRNTKRSIRVYVLYCAVYTGNKRINICKTPFF